MALHHNFDVHDPYLMNQKASKPEQNPQPKVSVQLKAISSLKLSPDSKLNNDLAQLQHKRSPKQVYQPN